MRRGRSVRVVVGATTAAALLWWGLAAPVLAETPGPTPMPTPSVLGPTPATPAATTPAPTPETTAATTAGTTAGTTATPSPTPPDATPSPRTVGGAGPVALSLAVDSGGGPVVGAFYEDLGNFAFRGTTALADGSTVQVQRRDGAAWTTVATTTTGNGGTYAASLPVTAAGAVTFRASATGTEGAPLTSEAVAVTVQDATVAVSVPAKVDALKDAPLSGQVVPARAGVVVSVEVRSGSTWRNLTHVTTAADGRFVTPVAYGLGQLRRYDVRATYPAVNRHRTEVSTARGFSRIAVLDPSVDGTTRGDVAKTYRRGCPVGPSRLSTVHLNYYGFDKRMHRGVIIIRTDLRQEIVRGFGAALKHRYPIAKMRNPNAYGGNDPRQMKADNTSGFNCRKVVGNPYKMSPHSYGIALDVNTVQNPYRDGHGKWWPSNGKKYRDRSPLRRGMLGTSSWLTKSLRKDHFFWGGKWNPGRDYQHFEYRG